MKLNWSQDVYLKAWNFATLVHSGQRYASSVAGQDFPYINHIGSVAMELIFGLASDVNLNGNLAIQCALLHDTLEDTEFDFEFIKFTFGGDVAEGVQALTKDDTLVTKQEQMLDSLKRIKLQPKEIWMVKLADRITNLSEPPAHWDSVRKSAYLQEAMVIYQHLHEANELLGARLQQRIESYRKYIG
ncbi:HD domain-containing protein [Microbulbifer sp. MLAF003]|uniref:HD domain-containing protein n=1 Tax=Microbulbifer sp. MLAF003 TaxID=3032582 RepID=UPI0024AD5BF4|nr:HD domain-containing protein [Microbulbifer sp. MLAF003]WHI49298.1 HD domain-containing protein [Microbulbifer sp. MLAF003]